LPARYVTGVKKTSPVLSLAVRGRTYRTGRDGPAGTGGGATLKVSEKSLKLNVGAALLTL